jgi:acetolactate synthase regulatory subunit
VFTQLNSIFSNAKKISIDSDRSFKGSKLVFTADSQENQIHFGVASAISVVHRQLEKISDVIDLTSSGREQLPTATDTQRMAIQANPQINAVLFRLN